MSLRKPLVSVSLLSLAALAFGFGLGHPDEAQGRRMPMQNVEFDDMMFEEPFMDHGGFGFSVAQFRLDDMPLGGTTAPTVTPHAGSHGGTLALDAHGVLALDRDSGKLVRTTRAGEQLASLEFGVGAGELVSDPKHELVYVADRQANKVVRVRAGARSFEVLDSAAVREPHGLALSPDGATIYITSVANHELVALDTQTMHPRWRVALAAEPRGVAVAADGKHAIVGFLTTGAVASVDLGTSPSVDYVTLDPAHRVGTDPFSGEFMNADAGFEAPRFMGGDPSLADLKDVGLRFARNTYAVGYIGNDLAIAPHQLSTPHLPSNGFEDTGSYGGGGGFTAPITHRMAMIDAENSFAPSLAFAEIGVHQPRALAYDAGSDTLFLAGYGNDQIMAVAEVSQSSIHMSWITVAQSANGACGPDGLAVDGAELFVHCELDRSLVRVDLSTVESVGVPSSMPLGDSLGPSSRSAAAQRGAELFRRGQDHRISTGGVMACASCHAEGRTDGLSWRIEGHNLQTPLLAGRVAGSHPFKWDGKDSDLPTSLSNTVGRLGGSGLGPREVADLQAFLESLPQPVPPAADDAKTIARGKEVFESAEAACSACHDGPKFADGQLHDLATNIGSVDTPSLIGLAHTAPYYHDGSARTLRALLTDKGSVHDMGQTAHLNERQLGDLIAYLESL
ncbi:c-type cytochrome [Enhygromyxa salina]|uniref:Cytochrome c n=1 Tax=Enhygromyxa salina TaxID=215803 RepID=A0A2S9YSC6_9BACT|nr:c-type cytochrome [Enhygromyxa salina]PRQ07993.1 Cytochrome c [Enhygromyxa salina]